MQTLDWPLRHAAHHHADYEAVVDGDTRLSFAQLAERCNRLGAALQALGIRAGDRVAVLLANSHRYLELHFAVPGIGAVIVPINSRLSPREMRHILEDSGSRLLINDAAHTAVADELGDCVERQLRAPQEYEALLEQTEPRALPGPRSENDLAGLYYTGGTTGRGKGVMLSHRNLIANTMHMGLSSGRIDAMSFLYVFPLFHLGAIGGVYALTWIGARQVFLPRVDPGEILHTIEKERITHSSIVPTVINSLIRHPAAASTDFSSLIELTHGAAPISPTLCAEAVDTFGCSFRQGYGMTEAAAMAAVLPGEEALLDHERIRSAGQAVPGVELCVRRPDGSPCAARETGEVTLRGPNIMQGYWKQPEATAAVLRDGWYWTGDLGWLDEQNYLFLVDRAKDMIVSGGENVYSVEVETALQSHPAVLEAAVIGIPDATWGEAVHAIVVPRPGHPIDEVALIAHCREQIAGYKCPKSISLREDELPKSGVGKILKRMLRAPYWEGHGRTVG